MGIKDIENLTVEDIRPITVSFKKNEDELVLYKWILKHSGYSSFIKDRLKEIMEQSESISIEKRVEKPIKEIAKQNSNTNLIDLNF